MVPDCFTCARNDDLFAPVREQILRSDHWRVAHDFSTALPGWLILAPLTHVQSLDELAPDAAAELGPLLRRLTGALKATTGCVKTYVLLVAEKPGFSHLHFHIVPRAESMREEHRGPKVFSLLGVAPEERVPEAEQDRLAETLRVELARSDA